MGVVAMAVGLGQAGPAWGDVASDRAAAIVKYPWVVAAVGLTDTVIQLSNTDRGAPIDVHCFYINANPHCTNTGDVCFSAEECCSTGLGCGICLPGWNETDFHIRLTPAQPIAWLASEGLDDFPIDGILRTGSDGSSNAGSRIPPVPEDPFIGELKCFAVAPEGFPVDRNVLKGEATLETFFPEITMLGQPEVFDVAKYNAVGIQALPGAVNDDNTLVLGGPEPEYNGCPNVTIVNHFADFVADPATQDECDPEIEDDPDCIVTQLVLVPCSQDLLRQRPAAAVVQYLVYNEFEQRFSTSRPLQCLQALNLSSIDTSQPTRSIFSAPVLGTVTAQTRLTPIGSGLVGVAIESHDSDFIDVISTTLRTDSAAFNLHFQGDRPDPDLIVLP
jgi:hypothetical protein